MKTKLAKLSICSCGFPTLKTDIPLGAEYEIDPKRTKLMHWRCGGCKKWFQVLTVWASAVSGIGGYLPIGIFEYYTNQDAGFAE